MQVVSSDWGNKTAQGKRRIGYGVLVAWMRTAATGVQFFTIGQSRIGGEDIIKGGGSFVTFFDKYRYDDVSPFTTSISVQKKLGQFPYGTILGEADVELDNTSKRFLPDYDTTIGSGILPNRPIKISVGIEEEYLKLFTGFTTMPNISLNNRNVQLHAFDAFEYINNYRATTSGVFSNAPLHNIIASGMQEMGFSTNQYAIDRSLQANIGYLATYDRKWGDIFRDGCEAEQAMMFADETGIIRFWNRQHFTTSSGVPRFQLNYSKLEDIVWQNTPIINDVVVNAKPREVETLQTVWESESSIQVTAGQDTDVFIDFTDEDGELPVTSINTPVYITGAGVTDSYFAVNTQSDGSGSADSSSVTIVEAYNFGSTYKLVFRNSNSSDLYVTQLVVKGTPAKVFRTIKERANNQSSIDNYGRNPSNNGEAITIENNMIQDEDSARSLATILVNQYATPRKRYVCPLAVQSDPALQIGDAGIITIADTGESKTVYIVGVTNVINRNGEYSQSLEVEERDFASYFTIGQSVIGGDDRIAP